jgi:hypothetical protein
MSTFHHEIRRPFFTSEELQDLDLAHPGTYCMLVYAGLWCNCSKNGRFLWDTHALKQSILPLLSFELGDTLKLLHAAGFIRSYCVDGVEYGQVSPDGGIS